MRAWRCLAVLLALGVFAQPVAADPAETARAAALALVEAIDDLVEARGARDQVAALTQTIQAHEAGLSALRAGLRDAALREATIRRQFDQQSEEVSRLLSAMMAVGRVQGPALLLHPDGPLGTARAGMMLADLAPAMQAEADRIGAMLREMQTLRNLRETAVDTLSMGLRSLQEARTDLSQAMADRRDLPPRMAEDEETMMALLASAQTLEALATGLAAAPAGLDAPLPAFDEALGQLPLPVQGAILRRPGEADTNGVARPGLVLATEPGALVTAPWAGTVRYRGPLLDYGNVILLEPGEGYLVVLAGLDLVYPRVGDVVSKGDPMGLMPGALPTDTEFLAAASVAGRSETLYLELRADGQTIDPEVWFDLTGQTQ